MLIRWLYKHASFWNYQSKQNYRVRGQRKFENCWFGAWRFVGFYGSRGSSSSFAEIINIPFSPVRAHVRRENSAGRSAILELFSGLSWFLCVRNFGFYDGKSFLTRMSAFQFNVLLNEFFGGEHAKSVLKVEKKITNLAGMWWDSFCMKMRVISGNLQHQSTQHLTTALRHFCR